jgi:hypothetical protein
VKRAAAAITGGLFGLILTWICFYTFSHVEFAASRTPAQGCYDLEHCGKEWWTYPLLLAMLFAPSILFSLLNLVAWQRWTVHKWAWASGLLAIGTATSYLIAYALPL